jgi:spermidine synthase
LFETMPDSPEWSEHVKPYVFETPGIRSLHFSICEIQSRMQIDDPYALDLEYTRTMMGFLLFHPQPERIAMIGLGGGSLAKFCHHHLPDTQIRVVEINPHVIALRDDFQVPRDSERFEVLEDDGAQFVHEHPSSCDILMVDGFDPDGLPSQLSSQRFYDSCHAMLRPGGLMVANLHAADPNYETCVDRIRRSFGDSVRIVNAHETDSSNSIVFACNGPVFDQFRPGVVRPPKSLDEQAAKQLLAAFAKVMASLKNHR